MLQNFRRLRRKLVAIADCKSLSPNGPPLMNSMEHPAPACAGGQVRQGVKHAAQALSKSRLPVISRSRVHRPINQKRTAHDGVAVNKTPVAAVKAVVAVVAHCKISSGWNDKLVALNIPSNVSSPFWFH